MLAAGAGIEPLLVLSKADLLDETDRRRAVETVRALSPGTTVLLSSAFDAGAIEALASAVPRGATGALIGSSGAGKSTLVNCLLGERLLATQPVREVDSKGRHTTTRRQLIPLPQGWVLIDMPGLREVGLWAGEEAVASVFDDISTRAENCRFRDCTHTTEPGCAVRGSIEPARLEQFHQLRREAAWVESEQDIHARLARKRRAKALSRIVKSIGRESGA